MEQGRQSPQVDLAIQCIVTKQFGGGIALATRFDFFAQRLPSRRVGHWRDTRESIGRRGLGHGSLFLGRV